MIQSRAIYAGSFDVLTNGHLWMIHTSIRQFRDVFVVIGDNPGKKPMFTPDERLAMIKESVQATDYTLDHLDRRLLVDYAKEVRASILIRGIRNSDDAKFELAMCHANRSHDPGIMTMFLAPPLELSGVSSSFVKSYLGFEGWEDRVRKLVPAPVFRRLQERYPS